MQVPPGLMEEPEVMPKEESDTTSPPGISTKVVQVQAQIEKKKKEKLTRRRASMGSPIVPEM